MHWSSGQLKVFRDAGVMGISLQLPSCKALTKGCCSFLRVEILLALYSIGCLKKQRSLASLDNIVFCVDL